MGFEDTFLLASYSRLPLFSALSMVSDICEQILLNGVCQREGCMAKHDAHVCSICRVICPNQNQLNQHLAGKKHRNALAGSSNPVWCEVCDVELYAAYEYMYHVRKRRHQLLVAHLHKDPGPLAVGNSDDTAFCETCNVQVLSVYWRIHLSSPRHRGGRVYSTLKGALDEAEKNKNGVIVEDEEGVDFGILEPAGSTSLYRTRIAVENKGSTDIIMTSALMTSTHQRNRRIVSQ